MLNRKFTKEDEPNYDLWSASQKISQNQKQICRFDGKNKFIEFLSMSFNIDKIAVNIVAYDPSKQKGQKKMSEVNFYLDFADALRVCEDILNNNFAKAVLKELKKREEDKTYYPKAIFKFEGGTSAETLKYKGKSRQDGKPEFRRLSITPALNKNAACAITIEKGPGKSTPTSGIVADYVSPSKNLTGPDDGYQSIAILPDNLKQLAVLLKAHINGYITTQYALTAIMQENNFFHKYVEDLKAEFIQREDAIKQEFIERSEADRKMMKILYDKLQKLEKK